MTAVHTYILSYRAGLRGDVEIHADGYSVSDGFLTFHTGKDARSRQPVASFAADTVLHVAKKQ